MVHDEANHDARGARHIIVRLFRWHATSYGIVIGGLIVVNIIVGGGWWSFWPMCGWGMFLALHFFYFKSVTVDEQWAQLRTDDLKLRSYDLGHIEDIAERVQERDASVRPSDERDV